jgi:hypothetical protein
VCGDQSTFYIYGATSSSRDATRFRRGPVAAVDAARDAPRATTREAVREDARTRERAGNASRRFV